MQKISDIPRFEDWEDWIEKYRHAQFCGKCKTWFFDPENRLHIENTTMCLSCEHVEAERNNL